MHIFKQSETQSFHAFINTLS